MKNQRLDGEFRHVIYSPKGAIEGVLLTVDEQPVQVVMDPKGAEGAAFLDTSEGAVVKLQVTEGKPSSKGPAEHPVYHLDRVVAIDGKKPAADESAGKPMKGVVARLNYAKHGSANGVVLKSGDFVHLKPEGMAAARLKVGDSITARGETRSMAQGKHRVIEAETLNGKKVHRKG